MTGRNDPCPCGSGKKYKKCHLDADAEPRRETSRLEWVHEMDRRLVNALVDFDEGLYDLDTYDIEDELFELLMPWAAWTARRKGRRIADAFLEQRGGRLSDVEREWFDAQSRSWLSIFEVTDVTPGRVSVRDLLTGETRSVHEERGSEVMAARDTVLGRIVDFRGTTLFAGMHGRAMRPRSAALVVEAARKKLRVLKRNIPVERVRNERVGEFLIDAWCEVVASEFARFSAPPHLHNTDGEPLLFVIDSYAFHAASRAAIEQRIAAIPNIETGSRDEGGTEFLLMRGDTLIARIVIAGDFLQIETNSENRSAAARAIVEEVCAGMLRYLSTEAQPPSFDGEEEEEDDDDWRDLPEDEERVAEQIRALKEEHYRKWLDMPLPALDGLTPRAARTRAASRRQLDLLLRDIENLEARLPPDERIDLGRIRRELGMDE